MIKIIESLFRVLVAITFGSVILFGLGICGLLLWDYRYMDVTFHLIDLWWEDFD